MRVEISWFLFFKVFFWVVVSTIFYIHPYLGKIPILTDIFQRGWNHQLVFFFFEVSRTWDIGDRLCRTTSRLEFGHFARPCQHVAVKILTWVLVYLFSSQHMYIYLKAVIPMVFPFHLAILHVVWTPLRQLRLRESKGVGRLVSRHLVGAQASSFSWSI